MLAQPLECCRTMLLNKIQQSVIGDRVAINTAFGVKPLVYADYTASGRSLGLIEDIIRHKVLPYYANTHTETSFSGAVTSELRRQSKDQVRRFLGVPDGYSVIFCGYGATAATNKAIDLLGLRGAQQTAERPVVFIGPYEHHSNELPWRECNVDLVVISLNDDGALNLQELEQQLQAFEGRKVKVGSFSAASNVTGVITDTDAVTSLLHNYGALSLWDYAAAAPYLAVNCAGVKDFKTNTRKDAVFLSPHKFLGGPETPGILVIRNDVVQAKVPTTPGGGTVTYVTSADHKYHRDIERREEPGTPSIIGAIRAGLVFKLYQEVNALKQEGEVEGGQDEAGFINQAITKWSQNPNINILGNTSKPRLPIISFQVKYQDKELHYGFVAAVLNDVFGIQARGGCSCAGPYAHHLLGIDLAHARQIEAAVVNGSSIIRPGWVRVNLCHFMDQSTVDYIVEAVELIAEHAWRILPFYAYDEQAGRWCFQGKKKATQSWFESLSFSDDMGDNSVENASINTNLEDYLAVGKAELTASNMNLTRQQVTLTAQAESLRWFVLPQEAVLG